MKKLSVIADWDRMGKLVNMKKYIIVLTLSFLVLFNGCAVNSSQVSTAKATPSPAPTVKVFATPLISPSPDFNNIGVALEEETVQGMFNGWSTDTFIKTFGDPIRKAKINGYERWYFKQGVEIDIEYVDKKPEVFNYIYINSTSLLKTPRGIGIGSTVDEVKKAYAKEINPEQTQDNMVVAGSRWGGIIFMLKDKKVNAIYITAGSFTGIPVGKITGDRATGIE